jgi:hypothetical protein
MEFARPDEDFRISLEKTQSDGLEVMGKDVCTLWYERMPLYAGTSRNFIIGRRGI